MNKPIEPKITNKKIGITVACQWEGIRLSDLIGMVGHDTFKGVNPNSIWVSISNEDDYETAEVFYIKTVTPSKEDYENYERKLEEYKEWKKLNPPLSKTEKEKIKNEKRKQELKRELEQLEKLK